MNINEISVGLDFLVFEPFGLLARADFSQFVLEVLDPAFAGTQLPVTHVA